MALDADDTPAALNRDLRAWVKNWTGKGIGQVALGANISNSRAYAATANANLVPRDLLLAIVRAAAPPTYDEERRASWIQEWTLEWERRWGGVEAAARSRPPAQPKLPPAVHTAEKPTVQHTRPNPVGRLAPEVALPAFHRVSDKAVRDIAANHVYIARDPIPVGYHQPVPVSMYLDLHSASCSPRNREDLARFLTGRVRRALAILDSDRTVIATPREGNILVASRVAELCGLPFLMVRTTSPPRFGSPIEGAYAEGSEAIVVDDIVMGSLIPRTANLLRTHAGLSVQRCASIFERSDVDARGSLASANVALDSAFTIDDELLATLSHAFGRYA